MQNPIQTDQLTITNIIPTGTGFGVTSSGINVFVPPRVISAAGAEIGDVFTANLVNNDFNPSGRTPLIAVRLEREEKEDRNEAIKPCNKALSCRSVDARQKVLDMLDKNIMTTAEIGDAFGISALGAKDILKSMWDKGEIAKATVYANGTQKRASFVIWALHVDDFLGEEIDG